MDEHLNPRLISIDSCVYLLLFPDFPGFVLALQFVIYDIIWYLYE